MLSSQQSPCHAQYPASQNDRNHAGLEAKQGKRRTGRQQNGKPVNSIAGIRNPEYMVGEEQSEAGDDAHHGGSDCGERRGEFEVAVRGFDEGSAQENENKAGQESEEGGKCRYR